jgi:hypothetical protein
MADHSGMKLGKQSARHDPRTLLFEKYLTAALPPAPPQVDWTPAVAGGWPMMANDRIGDCTCAAAGHMIEEWTANAGNQVIPSDVAIVKAYESITGYNPNDPSTDHGAVEIDVLNYWRRTGIAGHKVAAYVKLTPGNLDHIKAAANLFGGCYIGLALPKTAQTQDVWDVPPGGPHGDGAPGGWGGHAVPVVGYDGTGPTVVTWGALKTMTWNFWTAYCDEAYAILSLDFFNNGKDPQGFDMTTLSADLQQVIGVARHSG